MNNIKITKTLVFAALIAALILPFSAVDFADAEKVNKGQDKIKNQRSDNSIPLDKSEKELTKWFVDQTDPIKKKLAKDKKKNLVDALIVQEKSIGKTARLNSIPIIGVGYDYIDNSLEISIDSAKFNEKNIAKYIKKIRSVIGDEIDITISPSELAETTACDSRTDTCTPLKGGVEYGPSGCSTGFAATYQGKSGFLTAGHCDVGDAGNDAQQPQNGSVIGTIEKETFWGNTRCDCGFISVTGSMDDGIFGLSDPNTTGSPFNGMSVTMSGVTSGISSGTVTDSDYDVYYTDEGIWFREAVKTNYGSDGGDSGAPVISGSSLVGIQSGKVVGSSISFFTNVNNVGIYFSGLTWDF